MKEELTKEDLDKRVDIYLTETETLWIFDMPSVMVSVEAEDAGRVQYVYWQCAHSSARPISAHHTVLNRLLTRRVSDLTTIARHFTFVQSHLGLSLLTRQPEVLTTPLS